MPITHGIPVISKRRRENGGNSVTIGADPEFFVTKNGEPYPICGLLGGTKKAPKPFHVGHVQEDNVMAEFNIPPAHSESEFVSNVIGMRDQMTEYLKLQELIPDFCSVKQFPMEALSSLQAQNIGCEPDYNAYTYEKNPTQNYGTMGPFRTASFHVHIGIPDNLLEEMPDFRAACARLCDALVLIPIMVLGADDSKRRQFYGKAGSFRPKPYGLEYRGLGAEVLKSAYYLGVVYRGAKTAATHVITRRRPPESLSRLVREAIDSGQPQVAYQQLANYTNLRSILGD